MGKFTIAKEFGFDYGHRVHTQKLNADYSLDTSCACKHLHGHRGTIMIHLEADDVNHQGMVTDFKHLNWVKKFIDDVLDHKMILDIDDPLIGDPLFLNYISKQKSMVAEDIDGVHFYYMIGPWVFATLEEEGRKDGAIWELYSGLVFVPFVPTSENLSRWIFKIVSKKMKKIGVKVSRVQFYETPKSQSNYSE